METKFEVRKTNGRDLFIVGCLIVGEIVYPCRSTGYKYLTKAYAHDPERPHRSIVLGTGLTDSYPDAVLALDGFTDGLY